MTRIYKIYTATFATGSALTYVPIQRKGRITGFQAIVQAGTGAGGGALLEYELSFVPNSGITTNDAVGVLGHGSATCAAASQSALGSQFVAGLNVPVEQGDRVYVNCVGGANLASGHLVATIFVEE